MDGRFARVDIETWVDRARTQDPCTIDRDRMIPGPEERDMDGDEGQGGGEAKPKSGCGKWIGGCLVALLLLAIGVGYVVMKAPQIMRWTGATAVTMMVEAMLDRGLQLPDEERDAVMAPVERLADRVKAGEIDEEQAVEVLTRLFESNEAAAVVLHGFESRYVDSELIPESQRETALLTANRFASGILDGRIPRRSLVPLRHIVVERRDGEGGSEEARLKEELDAEDIQKALAIMDEAVLEHGIDDPYHKRSPDELSAMVDRAIERAIDQGADGEDHEPAAGDEPPFPAPRTREPKDDNDLGPAL